jgi:hypothetical protein
MTISLRKFINNINQMNIKPSTPSKYVWIIGLVIGILGIIGHFVTIDYLTTYNYPLLLAGFVLLAVGTTFKEF